MAYGFGKMVGTIELLYKKGAADAAKKDIEGTKKAAGTLGKGMGLAGAAVAGGFLVAINKAADFQKQISNIGAVSGATQDQMEQLRGKALQLGADTSFSASEAANAMEELVKAGISIPDTLNGAADATVALAAAGEIALPEAATIASNAMNQFKLSAQDMPRIADLFAGAANASAISVSDLGETMKYVGPVANGLGVSIDDTTTAVALLGQQGIKGSEAGTALRSMLARLTPATDPATAAFKELGLITKEGTNLFYDQAGAVKPLGEVIQILNDKTKGLTKQQRNAFTKTAFGVETMTSAGILAGNTAESFAKMADSISKVKAADVAKARLDNFKGAVEAMKGSLETVAILVGTIFLPALTKAAKFVGNLANKFSQASPLVQKIVVVFTAVIGVLLLVGGAALTVVASVGALSGALTAGMAAFEGAAAVITGTILPIIAIVAAIALLVAGIIIAYKRFSAFRTAVGAIGTALKVAGQAIVTGLVAAFNFLLPILKTVGGFFVTVGKAIYTGLVAAFRAAVPVVTAVANFIVSTLIPAIVSIVKFVLQVGAAIGRGFATAFNTVKPLLASIVNIFRATFGLIWVIIQVAFKLVATIIKVQIAIWMTIIKVGLAVLTAVFKAAWFVLGPIVKFALAVIVPIIKFYFSLIVTIITTVMKIVSAVIRTAWKIISTVIGSALRVIIKVVTAAFNIVATVIDTVTKVIKAIMEGRWGDIKSIITNAVKRIWSIIKSTWNSIWSTIKSAMSRIWSAVKAGWNSIWSAVKSAGSRIKSAVTSAFTSMVRTVGSKISSAVKTVGGFPGKALSAMGNLGSYLLQAGVDFVMGMIHGIQNTADQVGEAAKNMATGAVNKVKDALSIFSPSRVMIKIGRYFSQGFAVGIKGTAKQAVAAARRMGNMAIDAVAGSKKKWRRVIASDNSTLMRLVKSRNVVLAKLTAAQKKFADVQKANKDLTNSLKQNIVDTGNVTGFGLGETVEANADSIIRKLAGKVSEAKRFQAQLKTLAKKGVNATTLRQIVEAGPEAGSAAAGALASATKAQIKKINALQSSLGNTASSAAKTASKALYDVGLSASAGIVRGLLSQKKKIENTMLAIARSMKNAVKKALKIKSPSRVMAELGRNTMQGFVNGLDEIAPRVQSISAEAARMLPRTTSPAVSASPGRRAVPAGGAATATPVALMRDLVINPAQGQNEKEIGRQAVIRLGSQLLGRSVPIPAPAGGF